MKVLLRTSDFLEWSGRRGPYKIFKARFRAFPSRCNRYETNTWWWRFFPSRTKQVGPSGNASALYSGISCEMPKSWLSTSWFSAVCSVKCRDNMYLTLGHDRFLQHPFQFIIHSPSLIRCYIVRVTDSIVKQTTHNQIFIPIHLKGLQK
jgi:hypothetical protein